MTHQHAARLEQCDDLAPTTLGTLYDALQGFGAEKLGDGHAADGRVVRQRDHLVTVTAQHVGLHVLDRDV